MKGKLSTLAIVLLALMNILTFVYSTQSYNEVRSIATKPQEPSKIVYVQAKDGKTPVKGIDYFDGKNGINAVSFSVTTTIVKDIPLLGERGEAGKDGRDGIDAPYQDIRINTETGDLESKLSSDRTWNVLISCSQLQVGCPQ